MFGKIIAVLIIFIAIYTIYRIHERSKIKLELQSKHRRKVTDQEVLIEQQKRDDEAIKQYQALIEALSANNNQNISQKKQEYSADEKREYAIKQKMLKEEKEQKGKIYEAFVAEHYRSLGYEVIEHGKIMGKKDAGIDLIAKNDKEVIMIQCKNWKSGTKYTINHSMISAFVGNVEMFLAKNPEYKTYEIKRIFTTSEAILDKSALAHINNNNEMVRYEHIPLT